jgi:hypothetical protein
MSYIGLWSYYNFDNWTYQPSYVSSNTPWFFNGARVQIFPSDKLKIEPWLINGWQSYGTFGHQPGVGMQILWKPTGSVTFVGNQYYGSDDLNMPDRRRAHTDDSVMAKYYDNDGGGLSQAAASLTFDAGCDWGSSNTTVTSVSPDATCGNNHFIGFMAYNRFWFDHNHFGLTVGGGAIDNPGRYLVLTPPVDGATAASGTSFFPQTPGEPFWAWDAQITGDYMPTRNITFRLEYTHRWSSVPYFAGAGGMTPPGAVNGVAPTSTGGAGVPGGTVTNWSPDLVQSEDRVTGAFMVRL